MDEHRGPAERVLDGHQCLHRARPDDGRRTALEQLAFTRVEVADAGQHDLLGRDRVAQPGVPFPARAGQAHAAQIAAGAGVRGVVVPVGVEPQHLRLGAVTESGGQRRHRDRAVGRRHDRYAPARQRIVDLPSRLEQAAARLGEVVLVGRLARLGAGADVAGLDPQPLADQRRERLGAERRARSAIGRATAKADERDVHLPDQCGSRLSKKALTPSWMSSVVKATDNWERR